MGVKRRRLSGRRLLIVMFILIVQNSQNGMFIYVPFTWALLKKEAFIYLNVLCWQVASDIDRGKVLADQLQSFSKVHE